MRTDISAWENEGGSPTPRNDEFMSRQTIDVTIYDRSGHPFTYNAVAANFRSAIQSAAAWFKDRDGQSPKPTRDTVYELSVPGDFRKWRICGGTVQAVGLRQAEGILQMPSVTTDSRLAANSEPRPQG
jgi:hypothetical protein